MASTHSEIGKAKSASVEVLNCEVDDMWVGSVEVPPPEFKRLSHYRKLWKCKDSATRARLYDMIDSGEVESESFYVKRRDGKPDNITHYKLL